MNDLALRNRAFSPDIFALQIAWDSTSLGLLKECPRKYYYSMVEGWSPRAQSVHLTFGQHYHKALEAYDHARSWGEDHEVATEYALFTALIISWDFPHQRPWLSDDPNKNRLTLIRSVLWYLETFADDSIQTVSLANGKPAVELSFRLELPDYVSPDGQPYLLCGHLDRIGYFQDQIYIVDRKTTKSTISTDFFSKFSPDNQFQTYTLAGELVYQIQTKGLIVDGAQIAVGFTRFQRGFVTFSQSQTAEFYKELGVWFKTGETYALAGFWPKNEKSCGNYGGCAFRPICSKPPSIRQDWLQAAFYQRVWDPLAVRGDI